MKIALCSTFVPFINGGYRHIVEWLEIELRRAGHEVERIYLPEDDTPVKLGHQMAAFRWLDLSSADRVICFRPQAHLIRHPHKIVWFIHHIRVLYDLWDTAYRVFSDDAEHRAIRDMVRDADTVALKEARALFTNSHVVARRLADFNGLAGEVLYPPVVDPQRYRHEKYGDEIVCICRIEGHKRQHMLIDAMRHTRSDVRLRICGASADPVYVAELRKQVAKYELGNRVVIEDRWISEDEKIAYLSTCLAAAYVPADEDSYGYPVLEAAHAGKPSLSMSDAGGVLEFVQHEKQGLIAAPTAESLARCMDELQMRRERTVEMGRHALARIDELGISWKHVLSRLLA
jgi:glycosyltransferase involved in cell wall biosynthesis